MLQSFECPINFHSNSIIQSCPSITLGRNNVFHSSGIVLGGICTILLQSFQKLFSCSVIIFIGKFESRETSQSEPSTFRVMNIPKKPQAAMPTSLRMKVK